SRVRPVSRRPCRRWSRARSFRDRASPWATPSTGVTTTRPRARRRKRVPRPARMTCNMPASSRSGMPSATAPRSIPTRTIATAIRACSIVASICARNVTKNTDPDFGYRPAIAAIVDRLKEQLGNRCLPRALVVDQADGTVPCSLVETTPQPPKDPTTGAELACPPCEAQFARKIPDPQVDRQVRGQLALEIGKPCGSADPTCSRACLCEVQQVSQVDRPDKARALHLRHLLHLAQAR